MKILVDDLWVFDFTGPALPEEIWQVKLGLIEQYASQKKVCSRFFPMVRKEGLVACLGVNFEIV